MEKEIKTEELVKYEKYYSEDGLWKKLGNVAKKAGLKTVYQVLLLYYVLINESTPKKYYSGGYDIDDDLLELAGLK